MQAYDGSVLKTQAQHSAAGDTMNCALAISEDSCHAQSRTHRETQRHSRPRTYTQTDSVTHWTPCSVKLRWWRWFALYCMACVTRDTGLGRAPAQGSPGLGRPQDQKQKQTGREKQHLLPRPEALALLPSTQKYCTHLEYTAFLLTVPP